MGVSILRSRKGVVFTVLAIVIAIFFSIIFSSRIQAPVDQGVDVTQARVGVLISYSDNFYEYAEAAGAISGYYAFRGIIEEIATSKNYTTDFEDKYLYCLEKGNLTPDTICPGMENHTLTHYLDSIMSLAEQEMNINSVYSINQLNISQKTDAFSVTLSFNLSLNITDDYAAIYEKRRVASTVNINGLRDPLYLVNGSYNQTVQKTSLKRKEGDWKQSDLVQLFNNHTYRNYKEGISFINRIKGNLSTNEFGIESFVNHTHPDVAAVLSANHSMTDYQFWHDIRMSCKEEIVVIDNSIIPGGFQIDDTHRLSFNISNVNASFTC